MRSQQPSSYQSDHREVGAGGGQQRTPGGRDSAVLGRGQGQRREFLSDVLAAAAAVTLSE